MTDERRGGNRLSRRRGHTASLPKPQPSVTSSEPVIVLRVVLCHANNTGCDPVLLPCSATGCQIPEDLSRVLSGVEADPERAAS